MGAGSLRLLPHSGRWPVRVKTGKSRSEKMLSALPPLATGERTFWIGSFGSPSITKARERSWITTSSNWMHLTTKRITRPLIARVSQRLASNSDATRARIGAPERAAYGTTEIEKLYIYRTSSPNAPVFVFIDGGNWRVGPAKQYGYPAQCSSMPERTMWPWNFIAIK